MITVPFIETSKDDFSRQVLMITASADLYKDRNIVNLDHNIYIRAAQCSFIHEIKD